MSSSQRLLNYFAFDFERLFKQRVMCTKLNTCIHVFIFYIIDVLNKCDKLHFEFHFNGANAGIRFTLKIPIIS